ncbi:MAG TPA: hypothetical protein VKB76_03360, partial [Ktedonobacterales bacterium]|nr:hypothetical protein [Ktedonobacterales bacterium]
MNPETPTARLEELAAIPRLASLVAANPNASEETLLKLACDHPQSVLSNPIIPLLILEDPMFVTRFDGLSLLHFLKIESLPNWLLSSIPHRTDDGVQPAFRYHIS